VEEVGETRQQCLPLLVLLLLLVLQHLLAERLAEEQRLQHGVTVAGVAKLDGQITQEFAVCMLLH